MILPITPPNQQKNGVSNRLSSEANRNRSGKRIPGQVRPGAGGWSNSRVGFKFTVPVVKRHRDKYGLLTKGNDLCVCHMTADGGCDVLCVAAPQGSVYERFASIAALINKENIQ